VKPEPKVFNFDYVADTSINQLEIFDEIAKPITQCCMDGKDVFLMMKGTMVQSLPMDRQGLERRSLFRDQELTVSQKRMRQEG